MTPAVVADRATIFMGGLLNVYNYESSSQIG